MTDAWLSGLLKNGEGLAGRLLAEDDPISGEFEEAVKSFRR